MGGRAPAINFSASWPRDNSGGTQALAIHAAPSTQIPGSLGDEHSSHLAGDAAPAATAARNAFGDAGEVRRAGRMGRVLRRGAGRAMWRGHFPGVHRRRRQGKGDARSHQLDPVCSKRSCFNSLKVQCFQAIGFKYKLHLYSKGDGGADGGGSAVEPRTAGGGAAGAASSAPVVFCLHGCAYTGLSWALVARRLKALGLRVAAMDLRGHGSTRCADDADFSLDRMANDVVAVADAMYGGERGAGDEDTRAPNRPPLVLVGHSMGGAVAARAAAAGSIASLAGLTVVDIVEGTALAALPRMAGLLASRPRGFDTMRDAIRWAVRGGSTRNVEAACVSFPSQLVEEAVAVEEAAGGCGPRVAGAAHTQRLEETAEARWGSATGSDWWTLYN